MRQLVVAALLVAGCSGDRGGATDKPGSGVRSGVGAGVGGGMPGGEPTTPIACPAGTEPMIETTTACYQGRTADGVEGFLGIRYAEAPVGDRRWARTEPVAPRAEVVEALAIGSPCIQSNGTMDLELASGDGSEDCLFLNVLRPEGTAPGDDRPVMVFVHGGGNVDGHGGGALMLGQSFHRGPTDPPLLAEGPQLVNEQGAVVVTLNYRLGQLGWLAHPGLTGEDGSSGNQGLWDILNALEWVEENVERLGGDPDRVLLYGESAGSVDVCTLLTTDRARGLADVAILQSGVCGHVRVGLDDAPLLVETAHEQGIRLAEALGCTAGDDAAVLACMRGKTDDEVMAVMQAGWGSLDQSAEAYGPIVDGVLVPEPTQDRLDRGDFADIPVVVGVTADEGTLFTTLAPMPNEGAFDLLLAGVALLYGWDATELQAMYDPATHYGGDLQAAYAAAYGDLVFVCPTRRLADTLAAHTEVRAYWWTHQNPVTAFLGAHHGVEISYTFGTGLDLAEQGTMNDVGTATWYSVAAGAPEVPGLGPWPLFGSSTPDGGTWVEMSTTPSVMTAAPRKTQCDWMDTT
jgi:para-nitrobenzyl esterase